MCTPACPCQRWVIVFGGPCACQLWGLAWVLIVCIAEVRVTDWF